ncbi:type II toxin-antitoxin system VapC family toxin [Portibacter lacus]|uniref:Twitching motility protein PilT n=1 Tax=Portibacter lacus TaxID=1099794 RepID=A0AA37WC08_9BACT|nr:PIN domain-containing protein [Portibacter lacus]GLR15986.1 twitching motility protein PilT [Portibacter lacus]
MNVFVDTNVIIDLLAKREPFYHESLKLFSLADSNQIELTVSALSLVNTHYILNDVMKLKDARSIIGKFKVLVESHALNDKVVDLALNDLNFKDFEDGIQYYTALESNANSIITRNLKDFKHSKIPVMSPKEFLAKRKTES